MTEQLLKNSTNRSLDYSNSESTSEKIQKFKKLNVEHLDRKLSLKLLIERNFENDQNENRRSFKDLDSSFGWYYSKLDGDGRVPEDIKENVEEEIRKSNYEILKSNEVRYVTSETVADIILKKENIHRFQIVDARYPYEYEGGHINGSINLWTLKEAITHVFHFDDSISFNDKKYIAPEDKSLNCIESIFDEVLTSSTLTQSENIMTFIFYCEYSSVRAPNLINCIRNLDRLANFERYPKLYVPNVWILQGGYRTFYSVFKELCTPSGYVPMIIDRISNVSESIKNSESNRMENKLIDDIRNKHYAQCEKESNEENISWTKIYFSKLHDAIKT